VFNCGVAFGQSPDRSYVISRNERYAAVGSGTDTEQGTDFGRRSLNVHSASLADKKHEIKILSVTESMVKSLPSTVSFQL
jgi:hypothetical protein